MARKLRFMFMTLFTAAFAAVCGITLHSERKQRELATCSGIEISFRDSLKFIGEDDIKRFLAERYGAYVGQKIDSVRLYEIEQLIESRSSVLNAEAWITPNDGLLHVMIVQRAPAMRFDTGGGGFYIDRSGYVFPLHKSYTADVTVVKGKVPFDVPRGFTGYPPDEKDRQWLSGLLGLEKEIRHSKSLRDDVEGISIDSNGDLVLNLKRSKEKFIIGKPVDIREKFDKIDKYFGYIVPEMGEGYYRLVNLKYKNQIICRRKDI